MTNKLWFCLWVGLLLFAMGALGYPPLEWLARGMLLGGILGHWLGFRMAVENEVDCMVIEDE